MRSRRETSLIRAIVPFDLLAQAAIHFHANSQTYGPRPGLARWTCLHFRSSQQERPLSDFAAGPGNIVLAAASIIAVVVLIRRGHWRRGIAGRLLILLWCLPSLSMLAAHASFEWRKRSVLQTDAAQARSLGRHFIVGYSSFAEVAVLAEKGLISGVYVTRHNIVGSSAARPKEEISALQEKRP